MDKFMIDKYIDKPIDNANKPIEINNNISKTQPIIYDNDNENVNVNENVNEDINENVLEESSSYYGIIFGLLLLVVYTIYHVLKYMKNEKNYLIKTNANNIDITLDELKNDVKNFIKEKYEYFIDLKENGKRYINKYIFKNHIENGAFKATKYKATNLLSLYGVKEMK